jgi:hypothetical protein
MSDLRLSNQLPSYFCDSNESDMRLSPVGRAGISPTVVHSETFPLHRAPTRAEGAKTSVPLRRSNSLPLLTGKLSLDAASAIPARTEGIEAIACFDDRYGTTMPPNPKGKKSGIYPSEFNMRDPKSALVHPQRIVFSRNNADPAQVAQLKTLFDAVKAGSVGKWIVSRNGSLVVGPAIVTENIDGQDDRDRGSQTGPGAKLGHPTLIGGIPDPRGRIGGEIRFGPHAEGGEPVLYINNDSGRYSKYGNLTPEHLAHASARFAELGFPIEHHWIDLASKPKKAKKPQS